MHALEIEEAPSPMLSTSRIARLLRRACIVGLIAATGAAAQVPTIGFGTYTSAEGLSDNYVLCAMQDSHGFLWFGTRDGLNRFDGYSFVVYRHDPENPGSLGDGSARCIYEDHRERLWIGTHSSGLERFDRTSESFHHYRHDPRDSTTIGDGPIASITEDRAGDIWAATQGNGGAYMLDQLTDHFTRFSYDAADPYSLSSNVVVAACRDSSGALWVATRDSGLNRFDRSTCGFINHRTLPAYACGMWGEIQTMHVDRSGVIWIVTSKHLVRFDPATGDSRDEAFDTLGERSPRILSTAFVDRGGTCWIGTYNDGVIAHNTRWNGDLMLRHSASVPNSLTSNLIFCICEDDAGNVWFGSDHGISRLNRRAWQFRWLPHSPSDSSTIAAPIVRSLVFDRDGALWAGTEGGGLDRIDRGAHTVAHTGLARDLANPGGATVNVVYFDREGNLWAGTNTSLIRRARDGAVTTWRSDESDSGSLGQGGVWSILEDRAGRFWVGTLGGGLNLLDRGTGRFRHYHYDANDSSSLSDNTILAIAATRDGAIWIGTDRGLNRFDPATGRCRRFQNDVRSSTSLSNDRVWFIHEDEIGRLWIATSGGGVDRMDPRTGRCHRYMENNGFVNNTACAILEDHHGRIWASTNKGLACIDPASGSIRNFGPGDGLPVFEFHFKSCAEDSSGAFYFGGRGGVVSFHPDSLTDNTHTPITAITGFHTFDSTFHLDTAIAVARGVRLDHDDNSFSIELAALDFTNPSANCYRYMLEGYDRDWRVVPATHHFAEYTRVPPGHYHFMVAGSNSDGAWSGRVRTLDVEISPAYWQTLWFRALAVAVAMLAIAIGVMMHIRSVRGKERAERRVVEFQLQALRAQMNPHFLFNSLNSILYFVVRRDIEAAQYYLTTFSSLMRGTLEKVQSDAISLADELESLRLYLEMESLRFGDRFGATVDVSPLVDPDGVLIPPMIIQPYVENAIRHGLAHKEERGTLTIAIARRMGYLRCSIIDDGVGRARSGEIQRDGIRQNRAHSMTVTRNRLEALSRLHRTRYRVAVTDLLDRDGSAAGTRVDILFPLDIHSRSRVSIPEEIGK
jgi:ligand-binding sensor domain-containing protein